MKSSLSRRINVNFERPWNEKRLFFLLSRDDTLNASQKGIFFSSSFLPFLQCSNDKKSEKRKQINKQVDGRKNLCDKKICLIYFCSCSALLFFFLLIFMKLLKRQIPAGPRDLSLLFHTSMQFYEFFFE